MQRLNYLPILSGFLVTVPAFSMADELPHKRLETLQIRMKSECAATPSDNCVAIHEQAVALSRDVYGQEGEQTLDAMNELAFRYQFNGRDDEAERLHLDALQLRRNAYQEALAVHTQAPTAQEKMLAKMSGGNPAALQALLNNPEYKAQIEQMEQLAPLLHRGKKLKGDEPSPEGLIESLDSLGDFYLKRDRLGDAEPMLVEALKLRREVHERASATTAASRDSRSAALEMLKQAGGEGSHQKQAMAVLQAQDVMDVADPTPIMRNLAKLGKLYQRQGRPGDAEPLFAEVMRLRREMPEGSPWIGQITELLAGDGPIMNMAGGSSEEMQPIRDILNVVTPELRGREEEERIENIRNLAFSKANQGKYQGAEALYQEALEISRSRHGENAPETFELVNELADVHVQLQRDDLAEAAYQSVVKAFREAPKVLQNEGPEAAMALAALYQRQGRGGERQQLLADMNQAMGTAWARSDMEAPLGVADMRAGAEIAQAPAKTQLSDFNRIMPQMLELMRGLAGEEESAELSILEKTLEKVPDISSNLNVSTGSLEIAYQKHRTGELEEAGRLYREFLQGSEILKHPIEVTEPNPHRLIGLNGLANVLTIQGRLGETEPLYAEALEHLKAMPGGDLSSEGEFNPQILTTRLRHAGAMAANGKVDEAIATLRRIEPNLLDWTSIQLASTGSVDEKRDHLKRRQDFQNIVLTMAMQNLDNQEAVELAGDVMLRWKQFQSAEDALHAKLARSDANPDVRAIAGEVKALSAELASLAQGTGSAAGSEALLKTLQIKEQELVRISAPYKRQLAVGNSSLADIREALPAASALIEFRHYKRRDLQSGKDGKRRWAALLLRDGHEPFIMDLGSIKTTNEKRRELLQREDPTRSDRAALALYQQLFEPLVEMAGEKERIYIALDGRLSLIPIDRLMLPDGRYWGDVQDLRFLQTGRGLLAQPIGTKGGDGLLALGGIDFERALSSSALTSIEPAAGSETVGAGDSIESAMTRASRKLEPFPALMGTAQEVDAITAAYSQAKQHERVTIWRGAEATEAALKQIGQGGIDTPKILHLATHGFFLDGGGDKLGRPELDSGIALAGANQTLRGGVTAGEDGILYSLEAQHLNLEGTELVILSACDTAKGKLDYSEGVVGLVRALKIAGADNVLMTLWPLEDEKGRDFMTRFYDTWLANEGRSPAEALAITKAHFRKDADWQPHHWAPYVLIEG